MRLCLIYVPGLGMVNDPRVGLKLLSRGSRVVLSRKAPLYEILAFRAQGLRDGRERARVHDLEHSLEVISSEELTSPRIPTDGHLYHETSERPYVSLPPDALIHQHLRCHPSQRAPYGAIHVGVTDGALKEFCTPEIRELHLLSGLVN